MRSCINATTDTRTRCRTTATKESQRTKRNPKRNFHKTETQNQLLLAQCSELGLILRDRAVDRSLPCSDLGSLFVAMFFWDASLKPPPAIRTFGRESRLLQHSTFVSVPDAEQHQQSMTDQHNEMTSPFAGPPLLSECTVVKTLRLRAPSRHRRS